LSNVNSEDTGRDGAVDTSDDMGGASRVEQTNQTARGGGGWGVIGAFVVAILLLVPLVWSIVQAARVAGGSDSSITWLYASVAVLILSALVWAAFRLRGRAK